MSEQTIDLLPFWLQFAFYDAKCISGFFVLPQHVIGVVVSCQNRSIFCNSKTMTIVIVGCPCTLSWHVMSWLISYISYYECQFIWKSIICSVEILIST